MFKKIAVASLSTIAAVGAFAAVLGLMLRQWDVAGAGLALAATFGMMSAMAAD